MINLADLINLDMVYSLFAAAFTMATNYFLITAKILLPHAVAFIMVLNLWTFLFVFVIYLSVGIVVQYTYIYLWSVSPFQGVRDEDARVAIRILVGSICFTLGIFSNFSTMRESVMLSLLTLGVSDVKKGSVNMNIKVAGVLILISMVTNIILRLLMWRTRKALSFANRDSKNVKLDSAGCLGKHGVQIPITFYILASLVFFVCFIATVTTMSKEVSFYQVRMTIVVPLLCLVLPMMFLNHNDKIKKHFKKKMFGILKSLSHPLKTKNQIEPFVP